MPSERHAVIDVGSNSVKLLVAEVQGRAVNPVLETSRQTRLGAGQNGAGRLEKRAIDETAQAVAHYAAMAEKHGAKSVRVIATCAAREASNPEELIRSIEAGCGLRAEIISGEQEAEWVFLGVATDARFAQHPLLIVDTGGGSTEIIAGRSGQIEFSASFPIGSVKLLEELSPADPPTSGDLTRCRARLAEFFAREAPAFSKLGVKTANTGGRMLVGTGGTAVVLARMQLQTELYDREALDGLRLSRTRVREWMEQLWRMTLAERRQIIGLPPERADVILMGVAIFEAIMNCFGFDELQVSTRGLRFGVLAAGG